MKIVKNEEVVKRFKKYPTTVCEKLMILRQFIFDVASELDNNEVLEETFKWDEPSYVSKNGSTIRIDWKTKDPEYYAIYFHCKTKLVDTFRELYPDLFRFDGNRAIIFSIEDKMPDFELKHCIRLSLTYHKIKNRPLLGA